jgi:hypothetical protein
MKKTFVTIFIALFSVVAAAQTRGIAVSDIAMTTLGDSIVLEMKLAVSAEAVTELQSMTVVPTLSDGAGNSVRFPSVVVNGRNMARIYVRHTKFRYDEIVGNPPFSVVNLDRGFAGNTLAYSARVAADSRMNGASLGIVFELASPAGERQRYSVPVSGVPPVALPTATVAALSVENVGMAERPGDAIPPAAWTGNIFTVSGSERDGGGFVSIGDAMGRITGDPRVRIISITLTAYSSPEGPYDTNVSTAYERGETFSRWLQQGYGLPGESIRVRTAGENWGGLRAAVAGGGMPMRDEILSIIDSADPPDAKESRLRRMAAGEVWERLEKEVFPGLRKVDFSVDYRLAE